MQLECQTFYIYLRGGYTMGILSGNPKEEPMVCGKP